MPNVGNYSAKKLINVIDSRITFFQNKLISGDATADNLGNHIAIKDLNMSDFDITNVGDIALDSISADDGSSFSIDNNWTAAGQTCANLGTVTTADINGGTIDGAALGASSAITALTVDNIAIDGTTIGHTSDTDLLTLADGTATFTGTTVMATADINGGNVDGTIIGAASTAAGSFNAVVATGLGVGTSSPSALVDIKSVTDDGTTNRTMLRLHNYRSDDADVNDFGPISIDFDIENLGGGTKTGTARIAAVSSPIGTDHDSVLGEKTSGLIFSTMNDNTLAEAMRINAVGGIGIGTTAPISKLDVAGKIAITSEVATPSAPADGKGWFYTKSDGHVYWQSNDVSEVGLSSGGATIANDADNRITTAVGDGTFNAEANLIYDGAGDLEIKAGSSGDPRITFDINGTDKYTIGVDDSDDDLLKFCRGSSIGTNTELIIDNAKLMISQYIEHIGDTDTYFGFTANDTYQITCGGNTIFKAVDNYCAFGDAASPSTSYKVRVTCADTSDPTTPLFIDNNNQTGGYDFLIDSEKTTGVGVQWDHDTATTLTHFLLDSNSSSTSTRTMQHIRNDHTSATGVRVLYLQQDAASSEPTFEILSKNTSGSDVIQIWADQLTTKSVIFMSADDLTTGAMLNLQSNCADASSRELVYFLNDHTSADAATVLYCRNDGAGPNGIFQGGSGLAVTANTTFPKTDVKNRLEICHSGADGDDGILVYTNDTSVNTGDLLGGIGFDANDGLIPSSVTEAAAGILARAAEDFGNNDKGGELHFVTTEFNGDDDTTSTERIRIDSHGNTSFAGGKNILAVKVSPTDVTNTDERVMIRVSDFKIPQHSLITRVVASVSASTDLGTQNCSIALGTSKANVDGSLAANKIELLGAGSAGTRSSTSTSAAADIDMTTTGVWANTSSFWLTGSSYYAHVLNAGTSNGTTDPTAGALNVVIEWYGHGPQRT